MRDIDVGEKLDQYELLELIARSGMASIFKGRDSLTGEIVAVKVPYMQFESDVIFYARFQREEAIGQRLDYPNIVKVLTPVSKSRMYLVMEYVEGTSLRDIITNKAPVGTDQTLNVARQICSAIVYLHAQGVVHRDLKPENILVNAAGQVKIMDFGIALDESARRLTWSGLSSTVGTPDYMAPEQVHGRRGDARIDIYSLGIVIYEMLTAALPYVASSPYEVMRAKTHEDPHPPSFYRPDIDPHLEEIVLHAIAREPRDRYQTAAQMLADLKDPAKVEVTGRVAHMRPQTSKNRQLRRVLWTTLICGIILAAFTTLIWLSRRYPAASGPRPHISRGAR
jgi:eukaryotic-like serine/threonine-protein kinase